MKVHAPSRPKVQPPRLESKAKLSESRPGAGTRPANDRFDLSASKHKSLGAAMGLPAMNELLGQFAQQTAVAPLSGSGPSSWKPQALVDVKARFAALAFDPAKGSISPRSIEEAAVGLHAERVGALPGPIKRDASGYAEFIDARGRAWDVKSPMSPAPGQKWKLDAQHQVDKVLQEVDQGAYVVLNLSRCTSADANNVLRLLRKQLPATQHERVLVLRAPEGPGR